MKNSRFWISIKDFLDGVLGVGTDDHDYSEDDYEDISELETVVSGTILAILFWGFTFWMIFEHLMGNF